MRLIKRILIWIKVIIHYLYSFRCVKVSEFYSIEEIVSLCNQQGKSIIRFGDGEFNLLKKKIYTIKNIVQA